MNKIVVTGCFIIVITILCKPDITKADVKCYDCEFPCNNTKHVEDAEVVTCDGTYCGQYINQGGVIFMAFCVPEQNSHNGTFCEFHSWEEKIQRCHCAGDLCNGKSNYNSSLVELDVHSDD